MLTATKRVRALNEKLRITDESGDILVTRLPAKLGRESVAIVFATNQGLLAFTPANDPHDEHDFGLLEGGG